MPSNQSSVEELLAIVLMHKGEHIMGQWDDLIATILTDRSAESQHLLDRDPLKWAPKYLVDADRLRDRGKNCWPLVTVPKDQMTYATLHCLCGDHFFVRS